MRALAAVHAPHCAPAPNRRRRSAACERFGAASTSQRCLAPPVRAAAAAAGSREAWAVSRGADARGARGGAAGPAAAQPRCRPGTRAPPPQNKELDDEYSKRHIDRDGAGYFVIYGDM